MSDIFFIRSSLWLIMRSHLRFILGSWFIIMISVNTGGFVAKKVSYIRQFAIFFSFSGLNWVIGGNVRWGVPFSLSCSLALNQIVPLSKHFIISLLPLLMDFLVDILVICYFRRWRIFQFTVESLIAGLCQFKVRSKLAGHSNWTRCKTRVFGGFSSRAEIFRQKL